jgi:hypothetical protein
MIIKNGGDTSEEVGSVFYEVFCFLFKENSLTQNTTTIYKKIPLKQFTENIGIF